MAEHAGDYVELLIFCESCGLIFGSGIEFSSKWSSTISSNKRQCPRCGNMQSMPDGTFTVQLGTIVETIKAVKNPLALVRTALAELEGIRSIEKIDASSRSLAPFVRVLPKTKAELAYLILVLGLIVIHQAADDPEHYQHSDRFGGDRNGRRKNAASAAGRRAPAA